MGRDVAGPRTALELLRRATEFLAGRGFATPRLDAEVLLAEVLATDRVGVYLRFEQPLAAAEMDRYRDLIRRRAGGAPVAYLTGHREFWSRELAVSPAVLIPRAETELLVERALALRADRAAPVRILDLGTGSGALAVALATELPAAIVVATDVSPAAAAIALANARHHGVAARVAVVVGDWCAPLLARARFDVIVSNPPYVERAVLPTLAPGVRAEPALALDGGPDGLDAYRRLVPEAAALLAPGGTLLVEIGATQADTVAELCAAAGLGAITRHRDLAGLPRVVASTAAHDDRAAADGAACEERVVG